MEEFKNLAYHNFIEATPYTMMFERPPPREINDLVEFPTNSEYQFEKRKFYNRIAEKIEQQKDKYSKNQQKTIKYNIGEKVLIKKQRITPVSYTHLDVYKRQVYTKQRNSSISTTDIDIFFQTPRVR